MRLLLVVLFTSLLIGCKPSSSNQTANSRWVLDDDLDIPAVFESVCVDDPNRCGGTHIDDFGTHISVDFTRFVTMAEAEAELQQTKGRATALLRSGTIKNKEGEQVGEKYFLLIDSKFSSGEAVREYALAWTRGPRFAQITSESIEAIEAYEIDRGL